MSVDRTSVSPETASGPEHVALNQGELLSAVRRVREVAYLVRDTTSGAIGVGFEGHAALERSSRFEVLASLPPLYPEWLGDRAFCEAHNLRFPYVGGAMANGIASPEMVVALANSGMLGFLGTAGLSLNQIRDYVGRTRRELDGTGRSWGANLIHSPQQPSMEMATVECFFELGVTRVSASAFMSLTPAVVRYAATGLRRLSDGSIERRNRVFAKISRPEVAAHFMRPAPERLLRPLVDSGQLSEEEARLAARIPVAEDIIVESDSGGHTDNRPLSALFPVIARQRDRIAQQYDAAASIRLGAAGGLGTPEAIASAFSLGAAFVLTGSINQASVEAAQSQASKELLASASFSDVTMAPAGDMFEMGVEVQVLKRGSFFAARAKKLYEIYSRYDAIEEIPAEIRQKLERQIFGADMEEIWESTRSYFAKHDPSEVERAERDPKHRLALVCRWYLGLSSKWPLTGDEDRRMDYQIWMGPAQGAFNDWARGSFLENLENRTVVQMALNLLEGAAIITRAQQLRTYGAPVPAKAFDAKPQRLAVQSETR